MVLAVHIYSLTLHTRKSFGIQKSAKSMVRCSESQCIVDLCVVFFFDLDEKIRSHHICNECGYATSSLPDLAVSALLFAYVLVH